jgi:hypothetical protein
MDWLIEANLSENRAVSIFMAEMMTSSHITSTLQMNTALFFKALASSNQTTRQLNKKEHHQT